MLERIYVKRKKARARLGFVLIDAIEMGFKKSKIKLRSGKMDIIDITQAKKAAKLQEKRRKKIVSKFNY